MFVYNTYIYNTYFIPAYFDQTKKLGKSIVSY